MLNQTVPEDFIAIYFRYVSQEFPSFFFHISHFALGLFKLTSEGAQTDTLVMLGKKLEEDKYCAITEWDVDGFRDRNVSGEVKVEHELDKAKVTEGRNGDEKYRLVKSGHLTLLVIRNQIRTNV